MKSINHNRIVSGVNLALFTIGFGGIVAAGTIKNSSQILPYESGALSICAEYRDASMQLRQRVSLIEDEKLRASFRSAQELKALDSLDAVEAPIESAYRLARHKYDVCMLSPAVREVDTFNDAISKEYTDQCYPLLTMMVAGMVGYHFIPRGKTE